MKKIIFSILMMFMMFVSTGCVRLSYDITIDNNDKINVKETKSVIYNEKMPDDFKYLMHSNINNAIQQYKERGYDVKFDSLNDSVKVVLSKDNIDFNEAQQFLPTGFDRDLETPFVVKKGALRDFYKIHLKYSKENLVKSEIENQKFFKSSMGILGSEVGKIVLSTSAVSLPNGYTLITSRLLNGTSDVSTTMSTDLGPIVEYYPTLKIKIPVKATFHNANNVEMDNVYVWNLKDCDVPLDIVLAYSKFNFVSIGMVISILLIIIFGICISKRADNLPVIKGL